MTNWMLDSRHQDRFKTSDSTIELHPKQDDDHCDSPLNAMFKYDSDGLLSDGCYIIEFNINCNVAANASGSLWVGLCTEKSFGDSYAIQGYFFGGNVTDGSSLVIGSFGDRIADGKDQQMVRFIVDLQPEELKLYIVQNERPLGLAFHIKSNDYARSLFPAVHVDKNFSMSVNIKVQKDADIAMQQLERAELHVQGIIGNWQLDSCMDNGQPLTLQSSTYKLHVDNAKKSTDASVEDANCNAVRVGLQVINHVGCIYQLNGNEIASTEHLFTTMMAGPPEMMRDESMLSAAIGSAKKFQLEENDQKLTLSSERFQLHFHRYVQQFEPSEQEPISRK